jgi:hypothetical protein
MEPIIPIIRKEPFNNADWSFELKYDGYQVKYGTSVDGWRLYK